MIKFLKWIGFTVVGIITLVIIFSGRQSGPSSSSISFQNQSPQNIQSSQSQLPPENPQIDNETLNAVYTQLATYKLPVKFGRWQTCILEKINALNNLQLLTFYDWFKSLSPNASEETRLVSVSRKLDCPEPVEKTIPAITEPMQSFSGVGSKKFGAISFDSGQWSLSGSWSGGGDFERLSTFTGGEERMIAALDAQRGVFLCDADSLTSHIETCNVLGFGFDKPSGKFDFSPALTNKGTFTIKVGAPASSSWNLEFFKIIAPAKIIIE
jgi:hypothetical protein